MADLKISQLTGATTPLAGTELVPIVQSGTTKKVAVSAFSAYAPAFRAESNVNQTINNGAWTKVTLGVETFDTNGNFASSTFTPKVSGYYQVNGQAQVNVSFPIGLRFYRNGLAYGSYTISGSQSGTLYGSGIISDLIYMNGTTDYVELYAIQISGGSTTLNSGLCIFSGSLVRGT